MTICEELKNMETGWPEPPIAEARTDRYNLEDIIREGFEYARREAKRKRREKIRELVTTYRNQEYPTELPEENEEFENISGNVNRISRLVGLYSNEVIDRLFSLFSNYDPQKPEGKNELKRRYFDLGIKYFLSVQRKMSEKVNRYMKECIDATRYIIGQEDILCKLETEKTYLEVKIKKLLEDDPEEHSQDIGSYEERKMQLELEIEKKEEDIQDIGERLIMSDKDVVSNQRIQEICQETIEELKSQKEEFERRIVVYNTTTQVYIDS